MQRLFIRAAFALLLVIQFKTGKGQGMPALPPNQLVLPEGDHKIPFAWKADSINLKWDQYAALLVPVKLMGCHRQFYMQFDLGSPYSMFYKNKLKEIGKRYPASVRIADSVNLLTGFSFMIGKVNVLAKEITVKQFDSMGLKWDASSIEIIGTIGSDFIENKVVAIDYPGKSMFIGSNIPAGMEIQLFDFMFIRRSILLPATIQGKKTMLYFDTGSSAFELLTDKATVISMAAPHAVPRKFTVRSW